MSASVPTANPTPNPTNSPVFPSPPSPPTGYVAQAVYDTLEQAKERIDSELFLYETPTSQWVPSTVYKYLGMMGGIEVMHEFGVAGTTLYLGDDSDIGHQVGLVSIAAFLAQSMKETIKYDACDENSWDYINSQYPLSNACGQLGQSYQDYHCSEEEKHMECEVDPNMSITAVTHAKWYGAPAPLFCRPKTEEEPFTGFWDHSYYCNNSWKDPPETCDVYEGQLAGRYDNSSPVANGAGRTDVEGCCWVSFMPQSCIPISCDYILSHFLSVFCASLQWGRGVIQTSGVCNFGKLNYFLGARAAREGRPSRYPNIDFCLDPEVRVIHL